METAARLIGDNATWLAVSLVALTMPLTVGGVIWHRSKSEMGFGYRVLQFMALGIVVPAVVILALAGVITGQAVAVLVGSILGYLFSRQAREDNDKARQARRTGP